MIIRSYRLEVALRGDRNYVQGSQILGRAAGWLVKEGYERAVVRSAKFTKITRNGVLAVMKNTTNESHNIDALIGEANYESESGRFSVSFHEIPDEKIHRIRDSSSQLLHLVQKDGVNGEAEFKIDGSHESYIASVIETVKKLHSSLGKEVEDIWFTALTKAQLPIVGFEKMTGTHFVNEKMTRNLRGRLQTLSNLKTHCSGRLIAEFNIAFSCLIKD